MQSPVISLYSDIVDVADFQSTLFVLTNSNFYVLQSQGAVSYVLNSSKLNKIQASFESALIYNCPLDYDAFQATIPEEIEVQETITINKQVPIALIIEIIVPGIIIICLLVTSYMLTRRIQIKEKRAT